MEIYKFMFIFKFKIAILAFLFVLIFKNKDEKNVQESQTNFDKRKVKIQYILKQIYTLSFYKKRNLMSKCILFGLCL